MTDMLYHEDFVTWTERQAAALRAAAREGSNLPIDWNNLAEEVEDMGRAIRNRVTSLAGQIQVHLLKIACAAADEPRSHWMREVDEFREQLTDELADNPALRGRFETISDDRLSRSFKKVERLFERDGEPQASFTRLVGWRARGISSAEVLEDELYPVPGSLQFAGGT